MTEARRQYRIMSMTLEELNFILNLIADRLDELEGRRGTPGFHSAPNMNENKITNIADGSAADDAPSYSQLSSAVDHGSIGGLTDDDHSQYALLAGRSGGQALNGGIGSGDNLKLESTSHATRGWVGVVAKDSASTFIHGFK